MNIIDIEEALFDIAKKPYNPESLGLDFVSAFAKSSTTLKRLKENSTNESDIASGLLWRGYMHYASALQGMASEVLEQLKASKATVKHKVRLLISTDGNELLVFDRKHGDLLVTRFNPEDLSKEPAFFFPLAGLEAFRPTEESVIDIKATGKLAKLYDALIANNPDWEIHRHELNHFMTQIIFCLFAEDTNIFSKDIFTETLINRSGKSGEAATQTISEIFKIMDIPDSKRDGFGDWAKEFPYVNGGLFSGGVYVPSFDSKSFRFLLDAASIDWSQVNPDILGSSIQAIVDPSMRGNLGMHYTSVQNILKTLSPLFLDELKEELFKARFNKNKLHAFLDRLGNIKVFDPACGSGNFLVIAYREMRKLEMEALDALRDIDREASMAFAFTSRVNLSQFYGIEYADFAAETAKLALWIAEHQANSRFNSAFGMTQAALPLKDSGNIKCANALRVDWSSFCGGGESEIKVCGNPPYLGSRLMNQSQRDDIKVASKDKLKGYKSLDYVAGWFLKSLEFITNDKAIFAFVSTNSIVQGSQVGLLWPLLLGMGMEIKFAHTSFVWKNNAADNAGVICVIIGFGHETKNKKFLYHSNGHVEFCEYINPYLIPGKAFIPLPRKRPISELPSMVFGNMPNEDGNLILSEDEKNNILKQSPSADRFIRKLVGSKDLINGITRYCIWINDEDLEDAKKITQINDRIAKTKTYRLESSREATRKLSNTPFKFGEIRQKTFKNTLIIPRHSSVNREYLPVDLVSNGEIVADSAYGIFDADIFCLAIIASRMHLCWISTVCGRIKDDYRYSNTIGWHTFPVPSFSKEQIILLKQSAKNIILAREEHYPATIADLYDPKKMPENLKKSHTDNDQLLESMYRNRPFEDDQDRLTHLFDRYSRMI